MSIAQTQAVINRLRSWGVVVHEWVGWQNRGNGSTSGYLGGVVHHTASGYGKALPGTGIGNLLVYGRSDLRGPLCNFAGNDDGSVTVIAAGPANHAGASGGSLTNPLPWTSNFNRLVFGLEIVYPGDKPMTAAQWTTAVKWGAAVALTLGKSEHYIKSHYETSITGKWDPGYAPGKTINMNDFRAQVRGQMHGGGNDLDMATVNELFDLVRKYTADQFSGYTVPRSPDRARTFAAALPPKNGIVTGNEGQVFVSLVAGEDVEIAGIYSVTDWTADGKAGEKIWHQGKYVLKANDRQSFSIPGAATHVCVVYKSDCDFTLGVEVDSKWK